MLKTLFPSTQIKPNLLGLDLNVKYKKPYGCFASYQIWKKKAPAYKLPHILNLLTPVWPDRDDFIQINGDNIEEELRKNFVKRPYGDAEYGTKGSVDTKHSPYDVMSAIKLWEKWFIWIYKIRLPCCFKFFIT